MAAMIVPLTAAGVVDESAARSVPELRSLSAEGELPYCGGEETTQVGLHCMCYLYYQGLTAEYWQETNQRAGLQRTGADNDHKMTLPDWTVNCVLANAGSCCADTVSELPARPIPEARSFSGEGMLPYCGGEETSQVGDSCSCYLYLNGLEPEYWQETNQRNGLQRTGTDNDHKMTLPDWTLNCVAAHVN